ncbi:MAG: 50S ribosomal protein L11 methyltransferase [Deltaproteobacteria bacterium]|nr:50S ribosomal protein L11 methyltransferase [Deltaproteobacteria bacterium]
MMKQWFEITAKGPAKTAESVAACLIEIGSPGILEEEGDGENVIKAYIPADLSLDKNRILLKQRLKKLAWTYTGSFFENMDWLSKWKEHIKPIRISQRIVIKPTWKKVASRAGSIIIEIDPGMAFGTGSHASTMMCLKAADKLSNVVKGNSVLDVGTGSGILAITAAKLGAKKVVGLDTDPEALNVARANVGLNHAGKKVTITAKPLEKVKNRFSVIFANIIAEELIKIAGLLKARMMNNGFLILSGILKERVKEVEIVYKKLALRLFKVYAKGEWVCLVFCKQDRKSSN